MYLYTHIGVYLNLEIQNGLCKSQELTERWELPVCDSPMTACWDGFNFAEVTRKGWEGLKLGHVLAFLQASWKTLCPGSEPLHGWFDKDQHPDQLKRSNAESIEDVIVYYKLAQVKSEDRQ